MTDIQRKAISAAKKSKVILCDCGKPVKITFIKGKEYARPICKDCQEYCNAAAESDGYYN